ncbi:MAG: AEC family transporter [Clostridia bacterium]|nr:AEC family transporter [Clostridia bacterium]
MNVFIPTLNQMGYLFFFIVLGFILKKVNAVPNNTAIVLSKLENNLFIPALVFNTFSIGFSTEKLAVSWQFLLGGAAVVAVAVPVGLTVARLLSKDKYVRNLYSYGLCFSNQGFMGNAVVKGVFPDLFANYLILTTPISIVMYSWGFPALLIPSHEAKPSIRSRLKSLVNPMFVCMIIGMIISLASIPLPRFVTESAAALGDCMSPVAMLITGMTIAEIDIKKALGTGTVYLLTAIRLLILPLAFMLVLMLLPVPHDVALLMVCVVAMPLGLNSVVVPKAYGQDSTVASGMALISHVLACLTIPLVFMLFNILVK